jgi:hypothetical protein
MRPPRNCVRENEAVFARKSDVPGFTSRTARPDLVNRTTVRHCFAHGEVDGDILAHLPNEADESRHRFELIELTFVEKLSDGLSRAWRKDSENTDLAPAIGPL